jgi:DnaK suppressor protein
MPATPTHESLAKSLRERRDELASDLERLSAPPAEGASVGFGKRIGDGTSEAVERLATTATSRSLAASIVDIDKALGRIDQGTYGLCEICGNAIATERLEALPAAAKCIHCARA